MTNAVLTTMTLEDLKQELKLHTDPGDPWGSVTNALFDIAESLHWHHQATIPGDWYFRPGIGRGEPEGFAEACDMAHPRDLIALGDVLIGVRNTLEANGYSY